MQQYSENLRDYLVENYGETSGLAKELVDLLQVSKDSIYRRLRGEVSFTLDEAVTIAREYRISLDLLMSSDNNTFGTYRFRPLYEKEPLFSDNVRALLKLFRYFKEEKGGLTYVAEAFPIFRLLNSNMLRDFVVYYWKKVVLNYTSHQFLTFDEDYLIPKEYLMIVEELVDLYSSLDVTEIWTRDTIQKLLFQIEYSVESGFITSTDILERIYADIFDLLDSTNHAAQAESNLKEGHYHLYDCEIQLENNCVYAKSESVTNCFLNFNNFNSISIADPVFTTEVSMWIKNLKARSVQISGQAEKRRNQFFINQRMLTETSRERSFSHFERLVRR